jgi:MYXO-CTERM domain-containing protein
VLEYIGLPPADVEPEDRSRLRVVTKLSGSLSLSTDTGVTPKVTMTYGGPLFNMSADLSVGAANGIVIDFLRNDQTMPVTISLSSGIGTANAQTAAVTVMVGASSNPFQSLFSFASFLANNAAINFADVDRIVVEYNAPSGSDFAADGIGTIPTPGAAALIALGGLVATRRRRA